MARKKQTRTIAPSVRRKISQSLKRYYQAQQRERERIERARSARKGWETRRKREREQERIRVMRARQRAWERREVEKKEARRLAKWRKSYREYLKFRLPKKKRKELETPEKKELVCRVLFEAGEGEERRENYWTNLRELYGGSISNVLSRIPSESGVVRAEFRLISGEEFTAMHAGTLEEAEDGDYGTVSVLEWETELTVEDFWSVFYENARTLLPTIWNKDKSDYNAASLTVTLLEVCYRPGQISPD